MLQNNVIMPEGGDVGPARKVSMTNKLRFRGHDARSQMAFWDLNLRALQAKEAAQTVYRDSLLVLRGQVAEAALHHDTPIGSGWSGILVVWFLALDQFGCTIY